MKSNLKIIISLISIAILLYSGFNEAYLVNNYSLNLFEIKGYSIILLGTILYIYGLKINKKLIYIISYIATVIVYIYSINLIVSTANDVDSYIDIADSGIFFSQIGIGTYTCIVSLILHIISIFLPDKSKTQNIDTNEDLIKSIGFGEKNNISKDDYILCKYLYGCKNLNSYSNGALKINNDNSISIIVISEQNATQESKIKYSEIKNINIKNNVILTESKPETSDNSMANTILASAIIGGPIAPMAANSLSNQITEYSKIKTNMVYDVIIEYPEGTILIQTKTNPQEIVSKIKSNI